MFLVCFYFHTYLKIITEVCSLLLALYNKNAIVGGLQCKMFDRNKQMVATCVTLYHFDNEMLKQQTLPFIMH